MALAQALRWAGEAGLQELSAELDKALESGPLTRDVLDFYLAARGLLGGENPHLRDRKSRDQSLYEVAVNASRPAALRRQALRGVSPGFSGLLKTLGVVETQVGCSSGLRGGWSRVSPRTKLITR